jgi:putative FmdB family regulatory protein
MTYDYECKACGHAWEAQQSMLADPLTLCPQCGAEAAQRVISKPPEFHLRGLGWAKSGYDMKRPAEKRKCNR